MALATKSRIEGLAPILKRLDEIPKKIKRNLERKAMNQARQILAAEIKRRVPQTGKPRLLYKSIGGKVKVYRKGDVVVAVVGPRKGMAGDVVFPDRKKARKEDPTKIAHLVDAGTEARTVKKTGKSSGSVVGQNFMRKSLDSTRETMAEVIRNVIIAGLEKVGD